MQPSRTSLPCPLLQSTENFFDLLVSHDGKVFQQQPMDEDIGVKVAVRCSKSSVRGLS